MKLARIIPAVLVAGGLALAVPSAAQAAPAPTKSTTGKISVVDRKASVADGKISTVNRKAGANLGKISDVESGLTAAQRKASKVSEKER